MQERPSTWNVREGFDKLRWTDNEATVWTHYPGASRLPAFAAHPGVLVDPGEFDLPIALGLEIAMSVTWGPQGLADITIASSGEASVSAILEAANRLAAALDVGPVDVGHDEWAFTVDDIAVVIVLDPDSFALTLTKQR